MTNNNAYKAPLAAILLLILLTNSCIFYGKDDECTPFWKGPMLVVKWSAAQWTPSSLSTAFQQSVWTSWDKIETKQRVPLLEMPKISIQDHPNPLEYLEITYGKNWRDRPLLLQGLWNSTSLSDGARRLSLQGLLRENLTIPFYSDARVYGSLSPDDEGPVHRIVDRITQGFPHKIGTQMLVQTYPELIQEVAPIEIVTELFGNHFTAGKLLGHGRVMGIFPGTTTVPVFVASGKTSSRITKDCPFHDVQENDACPPQDSSPRPVTGLHCEPIGNVAVQLSGGTYIFFANRTPSTSSRFDKKELTYMFQTMPICQLKNGH